MHPATSDTLITAKMTVQRLPKVFQEGLDLCNHSKGDIKTDAE